MLLHQDHIHFTRDCENSSKSDLQSFHASKQQFETGRKSAHKHCLLLLTVRTPTSSWTPTLLFCSCGTRFFGKAAFFLQQVNVTTSVRKHDSRYTYGFWSHAITSSRSQLWNLISDDFKNAATQNELGLYAHMENTALRPDDGGLCNSIKAFLPLRTWHSKSHLN